MTRILIFTGVHTVGIVGCDEDEPDCIEVEDEYEDLN